MRRRGLGVKIWELGISTRSLGGVAGGECEGAEEAGVWEAGVRGRRVQGSYAVGKKKGGFSGVRWLEVGERSRGEGRGRGAEG